MNLGQFNLHKGKTKKAAIFSMIYFKSNIETVLGDTYSGPSGYIRLRWKVEEI